MAKKLKQWSVYRFIALLHCFITSSLLLPSFAASPGRSRVGPTLYVFSLFGCHPRLFICRPAALSAVCLSWLGRIWNLGEGGPLCTKQASQHSRFCTATDRCTEYTVQTGLLCTQRTTFTKISIFYQQFFSMSFFSLGPPQSSYNK
jgi:hypothetical protein